MPYPNRLTLLLVLLGCLFGQCALSQDRGVSGTTAAPGTGPQKWAVVIGVGDYQDAGIGDLPNAVNDARAIKEMLVSMPDGFPAANVMLLADGEGPERLPTRSNIIRFLSSRLSLAAADDTVLVYFAGHGTTERGSLFLLPSDTASTSIAQTGYAFADLETLLKETPARKRILILDACHSGTGRANESLSSEAVSELERASRGIVTLASCSGDEKSHEMPNSGHGAFTYFLLDALTGKADTNQDGVVSATEASLYTWDSTRRWASEQGLKQTPLRREEVSGEIMLAKSGGVVPSVLPITATATQPSIVSGASATPAQQPLEPPDRERLQMLAGSWRGTTTGYKKTVYTITERNGVFDLMIVPEGAYASQHEVTGVCASGEAIQFKDKLSTGGYWSEALCTIKVSPGEDNKAILTFQVTNSGNSTTPVGYVRSLDLVRHEPKTKD